MVFFTRGREGCFTGGLGISTGFLRGVLLVSLWWLMYARWFLEACFAVVKIFLVFELYFWVERVAYAALRNDRRTSNGKYEIQGSFAALRMTT
jgi:hypothetical protein